MNLAKLFEMQRELDERIIEKKGLQGQDLLPNKILALQVELGELANEWRGFKFWSENQEPRLKTEEWKFVKDSPIKSEFITNLDAEINYAVVKFEEKFPLLEEYVDCLHFILSIGLQLKDKFMLEQLHLQNLQSKEKPIDATTQFNELFVTTASLYMSIDDEYYDNADRQGIYGELFERFLSLGELLGFTWQEIEQAYFAKNAINHERQNNGY